MKIAYYHALLRKLVSELKPCVCVRQQAFPTLSTTRLVLSSIMSSCGAEYIPVAAFPARAMYAHAEQQQALTVDVLSAACPMKVFESSMFL